MKDEIDDIPLTFGEYKGYTPNQIAETDRLYIIWLYNYIGKGICTKDLREECEVIMRESDNETEWKKDEDGWDVNKKHFSEFDE